MIPYSTQNIIEDDISSVIEVLKSKFLTQGPAVENFEKAISSYCSAAHAASFSNATAALHAACKAFEVGPGDVVWTSPNSFVASANCALYCGASVDFVDICPKTYNLSIESLSEKLKLAEKNNELPKLVIPVHFAGQSVDMSEMRKLADRYGFTILEDASHALGGRYQSKAIGSCTYSDATVFSFHPVKMITTGEGGMVVTNNNDFHNRLKRLRSHGVTREEAEMTVEPDGPWYYQQVELGYNYRMTDIQAALGISQIQRLDAFVEARNTLATLYNDAFADLPLQLPYVEDYNLSSFHLYIVQINPEQTKKTRLDVFNELRSQGFGVNVHYIPIHLQPYYQQLGFRRGDFPIAENYYQYAITLPLYPHMSDADKAAVINAVGAIKW